MQPALAGLSAAVRRLGRPGYCWDEPLAAEKERSAGQSAVRNFMLEAPNGKLISDEDCSWFSCCSYVQTGRPSKGIDAFVAEQVEPRSGFVCI